MMSDKSSKQDRSTEVNERRKSKYYTRAAKKQSLEEEATKKRKRPRILKSKQSSEKRAKMYKKTFPSFKRKMIHAYGEEFYYNGGSWHGQESRRYRHYHIRKSMHFLNENMNSSDEE